MFISGANDEVSAGPGTFDGTDTISLVHAFQKSDIEGNTNGVFKCKATLADQSDQFVEKEIHMWTAGRKLFSITNF